MTTHSGSRYRSFTQWMSYTHLRQKPREREGIYENPIFYSSVEGIAFIHKEALGVKEKTASLFDPISVPFVAFIATLVSS